MVSHLQATEREIVFITHQKGQIAQLKVELRAMELGWIIARPNIESRYDLILDDGVKMYRGQIKYVSHILNGSIVLDLRRSCRGGPKKLYSANEIDVVLVYAPQIERILWVGPELFDNVKTIAFRLTDPKKNCGKQHLFAKDFYW